MEQKQQNPILETTGKFANWLKTSITARMIMIKFIILILLIPLALIKDLIREREFNQKSVVKEINAKHGNEILLYGPILKVPYNVYTEKNIYDEKTKSTKVETETHINYTYIFPDELDLDCNVISDEKHISKFVTSVFSTDIKAKGVFNNPKFHQKEIKPEDILWNKSSFIIKTTNLKGISSQVKMDYNGTMYDFEANFSDASNKRYNQLEELESSYINIDDLNFETFKNFSFKLTYNGTESIKFIPIGKTTTAKMKADWKDPKFIGEFPTQNSNLNENDFDANWKVLDINRPFSQQFYNAIPNLSSYSFGTEFIIPVDEYQKSDRSIKYGFMIIGLTFLTFFLIQTISKIYMHPFHYLMIGISLIMFYTLLLSISEHSSFLKAYIISGISVISLITLYAKSILKNVKFTLMILTSLTVLYSFIYVIIQLEDYALLVGSIGLFMILALVMYVSRKIDWQNG